MDKITHEMRCSQWTAIIQNCLDSGMSKKAWCRANGVSEKSFYYWQRQIRHDIYLQQNPVSSQVTPVSSAPVAFVELKHTQEQTESRNSFCPDAVIRCRGLTIEISNSVSSEVLKMIGGLLHAE